MELLYSILSLRRVNNHEKNYSASRVVTESDLRFGMVLFLALVNKTACMAGLRLGFCLSSLSCLSRCFGSSNKIVLIRS
jgi:hypothetical protein